MPFNKRAMGGTGLASDILSALPGCRVGCRAGGHQTLWQAALHDGGKEVLC